MKNLTLCAFFVLASYFSKAQSGRSTTPNSGANTTVPPTNTYTTPTISNPTNSNVPGSNGSYSVDTGQPDINSPNTFGTPPVAPNTNGNTTTYTPQTRTGSQQKKAKK